MKDQSTTIYDISEKAGVSIATVSRVLNGSDNVSAKTRQKVLDVIDQCGYTPNAFARGLGLNTMKTIGIMTADSSDLYLAKAIYYLEGLLRENGYDSILCCTGYSASGKKSAMDLLLNKKVDGILLVGSNFVYDTEAENNYITQAAKSVPVMLLNGALDAPNVYSITSDDFTSVYEATAKLLKSGITDIVYYYNSISYSGRKKLAGFKAAMDEYNKPIGKHTLQYYQGEREDIGAMVNQLSKVYDSGFPIQGIIASDDTLAIAAVKLAKHKGLKVPGDLSIIGYNNSLLATCSEPELTSIDNKLETLCSHLISTLMGVLGGNDMPKKTIFSGELILRDTTKLK